MKVFVTKYALTRGIFEEEVREHGEYVYGGVGSYQTQYRLGETCFYSRGVAAEAAERMRDRKVVSLRKQIVRLEKLRFDA